MAKEIDPQKTTRARAFDLWMKAPNPMVTVFKTMDVTNLVRVGRRRKRKFNMLMGYCVGKAAADIKEFYILPVGDKLLQYETLAVCILVKNREEGISSCDLLFHADLEDFNREYLKYTALSAERCEDRNLTDSMVIGTSAVIGTELDGVVGMYSGRYNNPILFWGRYRKRFLRFHLPVSFQFHHTQMDASHVSRFLENLQREIDAL